MGESWREGGGIVVVACSFFCRWSSKRRRRASPSAKERKQRVLFSLSLATSALRGRAATRDEDTQQQCPGSSSRSRSKSFEQEIRESQCSLFSISEAVHRRVGEEKSGRHSFFDRVCRSKKKRARLATAHVTRLHTANSPRRFAWQGASLPWPCGSGARSGR